jgi:hypothetical protein
VQVRSIPTIIGNKMDTRIWVSSHHMSKLSGKTLTHYEAYAQLSPGIVPESDLNNSLPLCFFGLPKTL